MSINQKSERQTFVEGLYQALFSFRLARWNVIYKAKRKLSLNRFITAKIANLEYTVRRLQIIVFN